MDVRMAQQAAEDGDDAPFWRSLGDGVFALPCCSSCGTWIWPVAARCGSCGSFEMSWKPVALEGRIYSWTRTWYPFVETRVADLPYVVLVVELPHAGDRRVLGVLRGDESALAVGAAVVGTIEAPAPQTYGLPSVTWSIRATGATGVAGAADGSHAG